MFIKIQTTQVNQNFNIWAYGDKEILRGSGLLVNKTGISTYRHFLIPNEVDQFDFKAGKYKIEIFIEVVNNSPKKIFVEALFSLNNNQVT
jgi:hypothetical protein